MYQPWTPERPRPLLFVSEPMRTVQIVQCAINGGEKGGTENSRPAKRHWLYVGVFVPVPDSNGNRVIRELSRGNELLNVFLKMSRWLEPLHKNIPQTGQHFCYPAPIELLQGGRDTWRKFLG